MQRIDVWPHMHMSIERMRFLSLVYSDVKRLNTVSSEYNMLKHSLSYT